MWYLHSAACLILLLSSKFEKVISSDVPTGQDYSCYHWNSSWVYNRNSHYNNYFSAYTGISSGQYVVDSSTNSVAYYLEMQEIAEQNVNQQRKLESSKDLGFINSPAFRPVAQPKRMVAEPPHPPGTPPPDAPLPPNAPLPPTSGGGGYTKVTTGWKVEFSGIPDYDHTFTQQEIDGLNSRPKASTDFTTGQTTATVGEYVVFGQNIGYDSTACTLEYWPPGPDCPEDYSGDEIFTLFPAPEEQSSGCYTGYQVGYFASGAAAFSWSDANTYNSEGVWYNLAMEFEIYDMDVCLGHAANHVYHHHSYSPCLQHLLNDTGNGHSPIYGWAYDGFPIFGPYQASDTFAVSCWVARNYSSPETGCVGGERTCLLVDEFNYTKGTTPASSDGPDIGSSVTTLSGNTVVADSGIYYEDFYWNWTCSDLGGKYLDKNNGHNHDNIGYHYHVTVNSEFVPQFPYILGPKYYGCQPNGMDCIQTAGALTSSVTSQCGTSTAPEEQQCLSDSFVMDADSSTSSSNSDTLSTGAIAGIVIAGVVVIVIIPVLAYFYFFKKDSILKSQAN